MSLSHALLGLLSVRPASGYDLMKAFDTSLANVWPATQSQVYGELARLADAGLIEVAAQGPRGRKEYTLTDAGLAELRVWMTDPRPEPPRRSEGLLRVFFLDVLSPEQAREYLTRQGEQAADRHARLEALRASLDWHGKDTVTTNGRLVLEYGLRLTAMYEEWAHWAAHQLHNRTDPDPDPDPGAAPDPFTAPGSADPVASGAPSAIPAEAADRRDRLRAFEQLMQSGDAKAGERAWRARKQPGPDSAA